MIKYNDVVAVAVSGGKDSLALLKIMHEMSLTHSFKIKVITIDDGNRRLSGTFKEIDFDGSIRIQLAGGQLYNLAAGDIL